jgi:hypothetical protein
VSRWWIAVVVVIAAAAGAGSFAAFAGGGGGGGGGGSKKTSATTTTTLPPTTAKPAPALAIEPTAGQVGTSFTFTVSGAVPAESITFSIRFPNNRVRQGQPHLVAADGTLKAPYAATAGNPEGEYHVTATGDKGTTAAGAFSLGPGTGQGTSSTTGSGTSTSSTG